MWAGWTWHFIEKRRSNRAGQAWLCRGNRKRASRTYRCGQTCAPTWWSCRKLFFSLMCCPVEGKRRCLRVWIDYIVPPLQSHTLSLTHSNTVSLFTTDQRPSDLNVANCRPDICSAPMTHSRFDRSYENLINQSPLLAAVVHLVVLHVQWNAL